LDSDFLLEDKIYTKLKLGRRAGIQSRKERMQEESNKEKREEERNEPILCYVLLHAVSAERDGTIDWNVYGQECTSQGKLQTLQVGLYVCFYMSGTCKD
jgi:hypothetical protein